MSYLPDYPWEHPSESDYQEAAANRGEDTMSKQPTMMEGIKAAARIAELEAKWAHAVDALRAVNERIAELEAERDSVAIRFGDMAAELARVVAERDRLKTHIDAILAANNDFRLSLPPDWESDPVNDACAAARAALDPSGE